MDTIPASRRHSSAVLHLLLASNPQIADMEIGWSIGVDGTIWPELPLRDPNARHMLTVLADALDLEVRHSDYKRGDGSQARSLHAEGRWSGVSWHLSAYVDRTPGDER